MSKILLSAKNVCRSFSGNKAVDNVSIDIRKGEITGLIGANGAGKSTTLRTIAGLVKARSGKIEFNGEDISKEDPTSIVKKGITLVPEGRKIFADLTVLENLKIGAYLRSDSLEEDLEWVYSLFPLRKLHLKRNKYRIAERGTFRRAILSAVRF